MVFDQLAEAFQDYQTTSVQAQNGSESCKDQSPNKPALAPGLPRYCRGNFTIF